MGDELAHIGLQKPLSVAHLLWKRKVSASFLGLADKFECVQPIEDPRIGRPRRLLAVDADSA